MPSSDVERKNMRVRGFTLASLFVFLFAAAILPAAAQTLLATVTVGHDPYYLAANAVTNKVYVANYCGNDPGCGSQSPGTVTVIDGLDRKSTRLNSSHLVISYAVFCLK